MREFIRGNRLEVPINTETVAKAWADTMPLRNAVAMHGVINAFCLPLEIESDRPQTLQNVLNENAQQYEVEHNSHPVLDRLIVAMKSGDTVAV